MLQRHTERWLRTAQQRQGSYLETGVMEKRDVQQVLGLEALLFRGRWEVAGRVDGIYQFNRNFGDDARGTSASLSVGARF